MENLKKHRAIDAPLEVEKLSLKEEITLLDAEIAESKELASVYVVTKQDVEQVKEVLGGLEGEKDKKEQELASLQTNISEVKTARQAVLSVIAEKQAEKDFLSSEVKGKKKQAQRITGEVSRLNAEKEGLEGVTGQKEVQETLLEGINKEIALSMGNIATLKEDIVELDKTAEGLKADSQKVEQEIASKEQGLAEREGGVSLKEVDNERKEKRLKKLKDELEIYYNRKFNFLTI